MSGDSGSEGYAGGFNRRGYENALADFREVLERDVVGWPKRPTELAELERLIAKYPTEARQFLDGLTSDAPARPAPSDRPGGS